MNTIRVSGDAGSDQDARDGPGGSEDIDGPGTPPPPVITLSPREGKEGVRGLG